MIATLISLGQLLINEGNAAPLLEIARSMQQCWPPKIDRQQVAALLHAFERVESEVEVLGVLAIALTAHDFYGYQMDSVYRDFLLIVHGCVAKYFFFVESTPGVYWQFGAIGYTFAKCKCRCGRALAISRKS
jgi:hypothetical protein